MPTDLRQSLGRSGEQLAAEHLERLGFEILARNHRTRWGEIDIIAFDGATIVFCEVKTRRAGRRGAPFDAIDRRKQLQVRETASVWLAETRSRPARAFVRFDAVGVVIDARGRLVSLDHLAGAF